MPKYSTALNSAEGELKPRRFAGRGRAVLVCLVLLLVIRGAGGAVSGDPESVIARVDIEVQGARDPERPWERVAARLLRLEKGIPFSAQILEEALLRLQEAHLFEVLEVRTLQVPGGVEITLVLKPLPRIKDIQLERGFPLFEREILGAMRVTVGDTYREDVLAGQERMVEALYARRGFPRARVRLTPLRDARDGHYVLNLAIDKGPYAVLEELTLSGNRSFADAHLRLLLKTWRTSLLPGSSGRLVEDDLRKDTQVLEAFYRRRGFAEARVRHVLERDPSSGGCRVTFLVEEGPRYGVEFEGNAAISERTLRKDLVLFQESNRSGRGVRRSVQRLRERYHRSGFLEARVEGAVTQEGPSVKRLRCVIDEGPCTRVTALSFTGNQAMSERTLRQVMLTRESGWYTRGAFVPETLAGDLLALEALYLSLGYTQARIGERHVYSTGRQNVFVEITIEEGPRTLVETVEIEGLTCLPQAEALMALKLQSGVPFCRSCMTDDQQTLERLVAERGYPQVATSGRHVLGRDARTARVVYTVREGPPVSVGKTFIAGNFRTRDQVLERELDLAEGSTFTGQRILEAQRRLRDLPAVRSVRLTPLGLAEGRGEVDLLLDLRERKPYSLEAGAGYESRQGAYAHARLGDRNFLGRALSLWAQGQVSQTGLHGETGLSASRFLGWRVPSSCSLSYARREEFNQSFGTSVFGATAALSQAITSELSTGLALRFERRNQFEAGGLWRLSEAEQFRPRTVLVITPSLTWDTRDSFVRPRQGTYLTAAVDLASGFGSSLDDFRRYRLDLRGYWTPLPRLTLAALGRVGYIESLHTPARLPADQLFYLGGTLSVRGFEENCLRTDSAGDPLGGRAALNASLEGRLDLGKGFELTLFYDTGRLRESFHRVRGGDFRPAAGAGLRYLTPVGAMGLLYGYNLDPHPGEERSRVHISVGYTF